MNLWRVELSDLFDSSYRKLSSQMQCRVDEAISHLAASENPADAGIPKKGRLKGYFAYEIGRSYRLIYKVISRQKIILLMVVGDHKSVYGRD